MQRRFAGGTMKETRFMKGSAVSDRERLTITKDLLARAAAKSSEEPSLASRLWEELDALAPPRRFAVANVAYYFGALVIVSAMTYFLTGAWDRTGGEFKLVAAISYAAVFGLFGFVLGRDERTRIPSGLLYTAAVCMTPLAVFGIESATHWWASGDPGSYSDFYDWIRASWVPMEVATIVAGLVMLRFVRFPFLVAPIAFALWFLSMDLAALLIGAHDRAGFDISWDERARASIAIGFLELIAALTVDRIAREDYAFWLYLFGSLSVWGAIWSLDFEGTETGQFLTCLLALAFIGASVVLGRRALAVFGALGAIGYIGHLAWNFRNSLSFPIALVVAGLAVICAGVAYQQNRARIEDGLKAAIPENLRQWLPRSRAA
jgi:hypothetical protein